VINYWTYPLKTQHLKIVEKKPYTYDALTFARTSSFDSSKGSRSNADKVVIVMTDGQSVNMQKTSTEAQLLKSNLNAKVFSIGMELYFLNL
jgi:hypothetical protein